MPGMKDEEEEEHRPCPQNHDVTTLCRVTADLQAAVPRKAELWGRLPRGGGIVHSPPRGPPQPAPASESSLATQSSLQVLPQTSLPPGSPFTTICDCVTYLTTRPVEVGTTTVCSPFSLYSFAWSLARSRCLTLFVGGKRVLPDPQKLSVTCPLGGSESAGSMDRLCSIRNPGTVKVPLRSCNPIPSLHFLSQWTR